MMRRIVSPRIDDVPVAPRVDPVPREALGELREALDALVPARRPALREQDDEARRPRVEGGDELGAELPDRGRVRVVIEVEVVEEAARPGGPPRRRSSA